MPKILNGSFSSAVKSAYEVNRLDNNSVKLKVLPVVPKKKKKKERKEKEGKKEEASGDRW
jgi:hypothetical protein